MSTLPIEPTECDRERFRDWTKAMQFGLEYDRHGDDYKYVLTDLMFRLWWAVERERQLLQNLNMSQGCKMSELAQKLEKAQMEVDALSTENGFVHQHAEEDKQELREQLEAEQKRLDWALNHVAEYTNGLLYWISDVHSKHAKMATDPRATIDALIAGDVK